MTDDMRWAVAVLAAGQGTRMKSELPKVLHELAGRPLIDHVLDLALGCAPPDAVVVVVGHGAERVAERASGRGTLTALQEPQLGTGDALRVAFGALGELRPDAVLVLSGDVPLLQPRTLTLLRSALVGGAGAALLTARLEDPGAYGRVARAADGSVHAVVEAADADAVTLAIHEVNAGVYAFRYAPLRAALDQLGTDNEQGEYYLTDVAEILGRQGLTVAAVELEDGDEMRGVNSRADLALVARILNGRVLARLMNEGVTVQDPDSTWVEPDCRVERDVVLEPGVVLRGGVVVGAGARIGSHSVLDGVRVEVNEEVPPLSARIRQ